MSSRKLLRVFTQAPFQYAINIIHADWFTLVLTLPRLLLRHVATVNFFKKTVFKVSVSVY